MLSIPQVNKSYGLCSPNDLSSIGIWSSNLQNSQPSIQRVGRSWLTLGADDQTATLLGTTVDSLDYVDQLLLVLQDPVELVVVASTEITHHVFVAEEEHECDGVIKFIHLFKVGNLIEVADVDDSEVLDTVGDSLES